MDKSPRQLTTAQALNRAAALCSRSEQSPEDVRNKLLKWGLNASATEQVVRQLIGQGFIDENRFARAFVNDRFTFNGWGRIKIAHQLRQKSIPGEIISEAMTVIDEDRYRQRLLELLAAKWRTVKGRDARAAWAALMRFAASRGFETGIAAECVKQVTSLDDPQD